MFNAPASIVGDPTPQGWAITALYAITAALCLAVAFRERRQAVSYEYLPRWFFLLGLGLLVLTVNKQLDVHALLTAAGRDAVRGIGLYRHRRLRARMTS